MDLNKKKVSPDVLLCQNEPDQVRQMITVTQNTARCSAHPVRSLNARSRKPRLRAHTCTLRRCVRGRLRGVSGGVGLGGGGVAGGGGGEREHLTLTSQRRCRLASSLVSIRPPKKAPDAFLPSECTCRVPIDPPPGPFHRREYTAQPPPPTSPQSG